MSRSNGNLSLQNPLITIKQITHTPSSLDGISSNLETYLRSLACTIIQSIGYHLNLPQKTVASATVLLHRFYFTKSIKKYPIEDIILASLFLAGKNEETIVHYNKIIMAYDFVVKTGRGSKRFIQNPQCRAGLEMKDRLLNGELEILIALGFNINVQLPYVLLVNYIQLLNLEENKEFLQKAWNYLNDSLRTIILVAYDPSTVACAIIDLTARDFNIPLPSNPNWFELFEANEEDMTVVMSYILRIYTRKDDFNLPLTKREMENYLEKNKRK